MVGRLFLLQLIMKEKKTSGVAEQKGDESLYHDIIQTTKDGFWLLDADGNILDVNAAYLMMSGYSKPELLGMNISRLEAKEGERETDEHIRNIREGRKADHFESVHRRKDGSTFDVEITNTFPPARNQFVVFIKDITERKRIEHLLRENERLYRDLVEETNDLITKVDAQGRLLFVNRMSDRFLGLSPRECLGKSAFQFIHADDREKTQKWFHDCVNKRRRQSSIENRQVNATTGEFFHMLWTNSFHYDAHGNLEGIGSIARDITESRHEQEKFAKAFSASPLLMSISTIENGEYIDVNECFVAATGYSREEVIGATSVGVGLLSQEDRDALKNELLATGRIHGKELRLRRKSGEGFFCRFYGEIITVAGEKRLLSLVLDITDSKLAEQKKEELEALLFNSQKMEAIGILAGGIAHDFNNILAIIISGIEMAGDHIPEESPAREYNETVLRAAYRARDLVKQILAFSRQDKQEYIPVKLHLIIKEYLKFIRSSTPTTIEIRHDIDPGCGYVDADSTQIQQVVMNLCTNALHAMDEKGILEISLKAVPLNAEDIAHKPRLTPGSYARLSISDSGTGMDRKIMDLIFNPFYTTKAVGVGTGMGLSVAHGIVESHGGMIQVESEPGKGTTFHVFFPIIERVTEDQQPGTAEPLPTGREHILFVDDEKSLSRLMSRVLADQGYTVTAMTGSNDALETFLAKPDEFDLLITDQAMPNMSGMELAQKIMKIRPDMPVILCTGFSNKVSERKIRELGIRELCCKPLTKKMLAKTIRKVLDEKA